MAKLIVVKGQATGLEHSWNPKSGPLSIGRGEKNDFMLKDDAVSRRHAAIVFENNHFIIQDAGSSNGVIVNDKKVSRKTLQDGDEVKLGNELLVFHERHSSDSEDSGSNDTIPPRVDFAGSRADFSAIIGSSPLMREVFKLMEKACAVEVPVMILGETGTGKDLVANAIHKNSQRKAANFIAQNCAAMPENMLESELFGYKRGAFTGADMDKPGLFEAAGGGTLFLDEIADASPATQAKLLRAVELGEIRRLGENFPRRVNVRVISATNKDPETEIKNGRFREDLFFRLNSFIIKLPPLRERKGDILILASTFLKKYNAQFKKDLRGFSHEARNALLTHDWRGNIRQLESIIRTAVLMAEEEKQILSDEISASFGIASISGKFQNSLDGTLDLIERICIEEALAQTDNNISEAAQLLATNRKRIQRRLGTWRKTKE